MSSINSRQNRFESLSRSTKANGDEVDESFRIGDFSSKNFTRRASQMDETHTAAEHSVDADDSRATKIEGGFDGNSAERTAFEDSLKALHERSARRRKESISLISESLKKDSPMTTLQHPTPSAAQRTFSPERPLSRMSGRSSPMKPSTAGSEIDVQNPDRAVVNAIGRHLVSGEESNASSFRPTSEIANALPNEDNQQFDSLQLQGGDISRELYNWKRAHSPAAQRRRSMSFSGSIGAASSHLEAPDFNIHDIRVPGGFRRSFITQKATRQGLVNGDFQPPTFVAKNFIEFLTLYGHFAGEDLSDDDDDYDEEEGPEREVDEESLLLPSVPRRQQQVSYKATLTKSTMLLLKAFIGTGVLFLPRGARNAGWLFSTVSLVFFSALSYFCFILLIKAKDRLGKGSYGDLGGHVLGPNARLAILSSIVFSQIGFAAAYIVFTATSLQAFTLSVFAQQLSIEFFIFAQMVVFIPLSFTRNIAKLSFTALIADLFILIGLIYVYFFCASVSIKNGIKPVNAFNAEWPLFIGTAIFTYEGIGLLIPIQDSMKQPKKFPILLFWVMLGVTFVFVSLSLVGYFAFGDQTQTVILLNFPQDSKLVSTTQLLYALAILLSTPLQLFPAIKILEHGLFKRSGKYNPKVKWRKNIFRGGLVLLTALTAWGGASSLDKFVSVIGSVACIPLIYVYPPLLHANLNTTGTVAKIVDYVVLLFGVLMMLYTSGQTISTWNK